LIATSDHKPLTKEGFKEVKDLKVGKDSIYIQPQEGFFSKDYNLPFEVINKFGGDNGAIYKLNFPAKWSKELGEVLGYLVGDGWLIGEGRNCRIGLTFGKEDEESFFYFKNILNSYYGKDIKEVERQNGIWHLSYHSKYFVEFFNKLGVMSCKAEEKRVPEAIFTAPYEAVAGFLRGLFSSDGTVRDSHKSSSDWIALSSKSKKLLQEVQIILLNLGIKSIIFDRSRSPSVKFSYINKIGEKKFYECDGILYELGIFGESVDKFREKIDFLQIKKKQSLVKIGMRKRRPQDFVEVIKEIEYVGEKEVYNLTEPVTHSMIVNGFVTRQCGEQPLLPYESCNLGSLNLARFLKETDNKFEINWERLKEVTFLSVRFLDNVIDANKFPLPQIKENTLKTRKIGLGIMGWATMLGFLGIAYDSDEAIELAKKIMEFIYTHAKEESVRLARERGVFPAWKGSIWEKSAVHIRNATLTTVAPTGTISIIAGPTSSGIEPNFSLCFFRNVLEGEKLLEIDPAFEYVAKKNNFYSQDLLKKIASGESIQNMKEIPEGVKKVFKTATEISSLWHIKMQAAFQEFTDNAVSKTINLPNNATVEDVKEAYLLAYKLNCKGITVYRDGSRDVQVLTLDKKKEETLQAINQEMASMVSYPKPRPEVIMGTTTKVTTGCGNLYITINQGQDGAFFEVFTQMGKAGGCAASQLEAVGRLISLALRGGVDIKVITEQLKGIRCPSPSWANGKKIFSCADAIARVLEKRAIDQKEIVKVEVPVPALERQEAITVKKTNSFSNIVGVCPECGFALRHQEGCLLCDACGYSKC
jgi:ribonucleoside-diphosphate reductase alpha chain